MNNKKLIKIAKVFSTLFMPLYAPMWVFFGLFLFSYMRMLPWGYKLFILGLVYFFTAFVPTLGITTFRLFKKWTHLELSHREHRHMPYLGDVCTDMSDCLRCYQCLVENQYTYGGNGGIGWSLERIQHSFFLQSNMAILCLTSHFGNIGNQPNHIATA